MRPIRPPPTGGPFTGEFLADHYRDISFYDEYVFPVTCEQMGFPVVEIRDAVAKPKAAGEAKGAVGEARITLGRRKGLLLTLEPAAGPHL